MAKEVDPIKQARRHDAGVRTQATSQLRREYRAESIWYIVLGILLGVMIMFIAQLYAGKI